MVRVLKDIEIDQITGAMTNAEHPGIAAAMAALRFFSCAPVGDLIRPPTSPTKTGACTVIVWKIPVARRRKTTTEY
jgi:hypothetical protein